jgi:SAM-dependent methyltransferase
MPTKRQLAWRDFLASYHTRYPGITEHTLGAARSDGADPYTWVLEAVGAAPLVVDLACGSAPLGVQRPPGTWVGIDLSGSELEVARHRGASPLIRADAARLPIASRSVPAVVCSMALMILQPLDEVLAEISRILEVDGVAAVMIPGRRPLTRTDLFRYTELMVALHRTHLAYPNDWPFIRLSQLAGRAGLQVLEDRRRRFQLPLLDEAAADQFVQSFYLPNTPSGRVIAASRLASRWVGADIGIPLRRIILSKNAPCK